jgi:hypothetical protein
MKHPEHEDMKIPGLNKDIKEMNGKSSRKLSKCIDDLSELLGKNNEYEKPPKDADPECNPGAE